MVVGSSVSPVSGRSARTTAVLGGFAVALLVVGLVQAASGVGAVAGLLSLVSLGLVSQPRGDDVDRLVQAVERLSTGDYDVTVPTDCDGDLGRLSAAVDDLAADLRERDHLAAVSDRYRRELYEVTTDTELDDEEKFDQLLRLGRDLLGTERAHVVETDPAAGRPAVRRTSGPGPVAGAPLDGVERTLCRETVAENGVLDVHDLPSVEWDADQESGERAVGCYIGGRIRAHDGTYGTVCFVDAQPREPFTAAERTFVDLLSRWLGHLLERRERERGLRETNERLNAIIEASPAALVAVDVDGNVQQWNPAAEEIFGWDAEQALGGPLPFVPEEYHAEYERFRQRLLDGEALTAVETRRQTKDGDLIDVSISAAPMRDEDGEVVGIMAALLDVTDRKERERQLAATTSRLEALFQNSPDMIDVLDAEGTIVEANRRICEQLGYAEPELAGTGIWEHDREYDAEAVRDMLAEMALGERRRFESRYQRSDGSTFPVEVHLIRLDLAERNRFVAISRDITDRKERERQLQRYKEYTDDVLDAFDDVFYVLDDDYDIQRWNSTLQAMSGYSDEEIAEMNALDFIAESDHEAVRRGLANIDDLHGVPLEVELEAKTGERTPIELVAAPLSDPDGNRVVAGIGRDITDRKEHERRLKQSQRQFEAIFDDPNILVGLLETDGTQLEVNETAMEYVDADHDDVTGLPIWETPWWNHMRAAVEEWVGRAADGEYAEYVADHRLDGGGLVAEGVFRPVTDEDGEVVSIVVSGRDITERVEHERQLRETKRRLELALAGTNTGVWEWYPDTNEVTWDETLERLVGLEPGEFEGTYEAFLERVHPEDRDHVEESIDRTVAQEKLYRSEFRLRHEEGGWVWVESRGRFVDDETGERRIVGVRHDITDRKQRERQLRDSERRLKRYKEHTDDLLDAIDDVFYVLDEDGYHQRWNESLTAATGYSDGEVAEMHALDLFPADERPRIAEAIETTLETGHRRIESAYLTADGERVPYEFVADRLEDLDGDTIVAGIGRDISERVEKERELSRLISNVPGLVYRVRHEDDWPTEFVSDGLREVTGYDPEALVSGDLSWRDIYAEDRDLEWVWNDVEQALQARESFHVTYPIETKAGDRRWVKEQGRGVYAADGSVEAIEGVIIDITERKQYEEELERTQGLLEQSQRLARVGAWEIQVEDGEPAGLTATDEAYRIFDLPVDSELTLEESLDFYHPEDRDRIEAGIERAIAAGDGYDYEARLRIAEGDRRWVRAIADPVVEDGEVVAIRGSLQDITDRKEREQDLERTTSLLDQAQRIAEIGGWEMELTTDSPVMTGTEEFYNLHGLAPDEDIDIDRLLELYHPDDRDYIRRSFEQAIADRTGYDMEVRLCEGGDVRWIRALCDPVIEDDEPLNPSGDRSADDGEVVMLRGSVQDITDRKEREEELERTTNLLEQAGRLAGVGGWEVDFRTDPPEVTWTEQLYRIHGLSPDADPPMEGIYDLVHPEDRDRLREATERLESEGESYDLEVRLDDGSQWVRALGEAIVEDGEVVTLRGSVQEITDQKEREQALQSLHETTRGLLNTESHADIADLVVDAADDVIDVPGVAVYLLDDETSRLEPMAFTSGFVDQYGHPSSVGVGDDSVLSDCFLAESSVAFGDGAAPGDLLGEDVAGGLAVPIGDHGVFVAVSSDRTVAGGTRRLVETLVATTEAAFDRLESESHLRERDRQLQERNRRLRRQIQITDMIRRIDQSLIGATSREDIERAVCDRLVEAEDVAFAWIGELDPSDTELVPRAWAGAGQEYLDAVALTVDADAPVPTVAAATQRETVVVENVVGRLKAEPWRRDALTRDFHSVVAVPLALEDYFYGVLAVYADEPNAFGDLERTVFTELGENIANSINAVETRRALHADTLVELALEFGGSDCFLATLADETGCTADYEGLANWSGEESRLFFSTTDCESATVASVLEDLVSVVDHRLVTESDDGALFEATVTGEVLAVRLVRHGASPQSIQAETGTMSAVVDVPTATDVREFVEMLRERYPEVELVARRNVTRTMQTRAELLSSLLDALTDRQREVMRTAYYAGFFEWPRASTGEDIAEMLGVSQPTVNRHLRLGQKRLLDQLFAGDRAAAD